MGFFLRLILRGIDAAPRREASPLQTHIVDRLDGARGPAWFDARTIEQALWVAKTLGAVLSFGPRVKPSDLTADQWDAAGRIGFGHAAEGERGIRAALDTLIATATKRGGKAGAQNVFGPLYTCVAAKGTQAERGDIRRILREHIFDRFELAGGAMVLGEPLPARRLHSVASLPRWPSLPAGRCARFSSTRASSIGRGVTIRRSCSTRRRVCASQTAWSGASPCCHCRSISTARARSRSRSPTSGSCRRWPTRPTKAPGGAARPSTRWTWRG